MTCLIITTNLKVAAVFAKTHGEDALVNDSLLFHHFVDWLEPVHIHSWAFRAEAQYSVGPLAVKVLGLGLHAPERIFKHVGVVLVEEEAILGDVALVAAALSVALIEAAPILRCALAIDLMAVIQPEIRAHPTFVQTVDVMATFALLTELLAGDGSNARARVHDQGLRLAVRPEIHGDVVVHEIGGVAIEPCRQEVHVLDLTAIVREPTLIHAEHYV